MPASSSKHPRGISESEADGDARAYKVVRSDSALPAPTSSSSASASPATFWHLPIELRSIIFDLATQRRPKANDSLGRRGLLRLDYVTLRSLTLVSRQFHAAFKPVLFAHVKITRPSVLAEFRRSLVLNPENGALVKSLHLGPLEELPKGYWPLRAYSREDSCYDEELPLLLLKTSWTRRDEAKRPRWCRPQKEWAPGLSGRSCQARAVNDAIRAAKEGVGVAFCALDYNDYNLCDRQGDHLGIDEWTIRVYEVQATLDLYLSEMRRVEQQERRLLPSWRSRESQPLPKGPQRCRDGKCGHYPRLVLDEDFEGVKKKALQAEQAKASSTQKGGKKGSSKSAAAKASKAKLEDEETQRGSFLVTRAQVNDQLSRRGSSTDHFDHPLIFARTTLRQLTTDGKGRVAVGHTYEPDETWYDIDDPDEEIDWEWASDRCNDADFRATPSVRSSPSLDSLVGYELDPTRHEDIIALGRSTVRLASQLNNLSLTGYLYHCIARPSLHLTSLRCVSVGPLSPSDHGALALYGAELRGMEKLRVCGTMLGSGPAETIGGDCDSWAALRETEWEYGGTYVSQTDHEYYLLQTLNILQGRDAAKAAAAKASSAIDASPTAATSPNEPASKSINSTKRTTNRYTECRLHPHLVALALNNAPSPEIRTAWLDGSNVSDAPHRVKLVESRAAKRLGSPDRISHGQRYDVLREESERWWEERALEIEGGQLSSE